MKPLILTFSGRRVNPLHINKEDVDLEDIAHHLACINRFTGAIKFPISVAQHVVCVSRLLDGTGYEEQGLHHDDSEAYLNDMSKWLKGAPEMAAYREAEARAQVACYNAFEIPPEEYIGYKDLMHPEVAWADRLMLRFEGLQGFGKKVWYDWLKMMDNPMYQILSPKEFDTVAAICPKKPWTWKQAEEAYLTRYQELKNRKEAKADITF